MNSDSTFNRIAGISAIVAAPIAVLSLVLAFLAVEFNADFKPQDLITLGARGAAIFRTAWMVTDAFGFALLLTPAVLYLQHWLKLKNPNLVALYTVFGLAYIFTEVIALSITGGAVPPMMSAYSEAVGPQRDQLMLVFDTRHQHGLQRHLCFYDRISRHLVARDRVSSANGAAVAWPSHDDSGGRCTCLGHWAGPWVRKQPSVGNAGAAVSATLAILDPVVGHRLVT